MSSTKHRVIFTEPLAFRKNYPPSSRRKYRKANKPFNVTDEFYKVLIKAPKKYVILKGDNIGNAYLFGKKYDFSTYKKIGSHGNDGAQTGLIDFDKWDDKHIGSKSVREKMWKINERYKYSYDSAKNNKEIRDLTNGGILFQGLTIGGDVGADLFAHYNANKEIDSLIIDNSYFYRILE